MTADLRAVVGSGAARNAVEARLTSRWGWPAGGLALAQLDALLAELRQP